MGGETTDDDDAPPPPIAATPIEHKPDAPKALPQVATPVQPKKAPTSSRGFGPFPPGKK